MKHIIKKIEKKMLRNRNKFEKLCTKRGNRTQNWNL